MRCFRLTRVGHADLSGIGGLQVNGRWHEKPAPILYASSSRALALLEVLVHLELTIEQLPEDYVYQLIDMPDDREQLTRAELDPDHGRSADTAAFGAAWLASNRTLALSVPSGIAPQEHNIIVNPRHRGIEQATYILERNVIWDERLITPANPAWTRVD